MPENSDDAPVQDASTSSVPSSCAGITLLLPGDVLCLLRLPFWLASANYNWAFAARQVAILCFMALAHIGIKPLAKLMLRPKDSKEQVYESEWWFDHDGEGYFCIKDRKLRQHRAPAALSFAVRRYLSSRPDTDDDHLFVTRSGRPLEESSYSLTLLTLARQLDLGAPVATMLKAFCAEVAGQVLDAEDAAFLTGRPYRGRKPKLEVVRELDLLLQIDPFEGLLGQAINDDDFAMTLLAERFPTRLPLLARTQSSYEKTDWMPPLDPKEYPLIRELASLPRAEKQIDMRAQREDRFVEYFPRMKPLLEEGKLPQYQAAELLGYSRSAWRIRVLEETHGQEWWVQTEPTYPGKKKLV